ncbi:MAG: hypothetical protein F4X96_03710 [Gammaproteobacteria bacterium]|nr:hypothetical protein [Chromatiales bacterium]MYE48522.1 hypothetical protein [Gammaproteobacteria bacterium]
MNLQTLWRNVESRLNEDRPDWREDITRFGQVSAVESRNEGNAWSNQEVFRALLMAVLSVGDWSKIESIKPDLEERFSGFDLEKYARRSESYVTDILVPWFEDETRKAGFPYLKDGLIELIGAADILVKHCEKNDGAADSYFTQLMKKHDDDPKQVALCLGMEGSEHKLPSLGVPLAAEALKNLGFDVAKPDRHVCRAVAVFGLIDVEPLGKKFEAPAKKKEILRQTMAKVEEIANAADKRIAFIDNAIWMLGAREPSGLHLTNQQLAELAGNNLIQYKDMNGLLALLDSWAKDGDVEEQKETLEHLIQALDENRPDGYKLFPPELKGKTW